MAAYVLAILMFLGGIVGVNDPAATQQYHAQLLECYDKYDTGGELVYYCDYRALDTGKVVEVAYQRQTWREMQTNVGGTFVLERSTGFADLYFFMSFLGVIVLVVNFIRRN